MATKDKELEAINSIISLLTPLDATQRNRVIDYVLKRLEMATISAPTVSAMRISDLDGAAPSNLTRALTQDIRSFTAEKQPRSINEMVAVVAYYVAEMAPDAERSSTINADSIKRYFRMAQFPLPTALRNALTNATQAGYLENVGKGEYKLNPVGYNLVMHGLPKDGAASAPLRRKKKSKARGRVRK